MVKPPALLSHPEAPAGRLTGKDYGMKRVSAAIWARKAGSVLLVAGLCAAAMSAGGCKKDDGALHCYVGGTMRPAMDKIAKMYEAETGQKIDLDYGDSGSNYIKVRMSGKGDLYVGHDPFLAPLMNNNLATKGWVVALLTPVIVVPKDNPLNITGLKSLAEKELKLVLTDADHSTLGHICPVMFRRAGVTDRIAKNVVTTMRSGGKAANTVMVGNNDAAIVWDAVAFLRREKLKAVPIAPEHMPDPKADVVTSATYGRIDMSRIQVFITTLKGSKHPEAARKFAEYVASEKGQKVFDELGFTPVGKVKVETR